MDAVRLCIDIGPIWLNLCLEAQVVDSYFFCPRAINRYQVTAGLEVD